MAYNTRRGGGGGYMSQSAASVGQRRPNPQQQQQQQQLGNNFVSGGQLAQPNKPMVQMPGQQQQGVQRPPQQGQQQKPPQQQGMPQRLQQQQQQQNLRQQAQQFLAQQQQQPPAQQQVTPPQQQQPPAQQQATPQQPKQQPQATPQQPQQTQKSQFVFKVEEGLAVVPPSGQPAAQPTLDTTNGSDATADGEEGSDRRLKRNKPFWMRKDGKINKKERLRRRNQRLRKILQPKNALMVLNELIGSAPYSMTESADMYEGTVFRCTVLVDGQEHVGVGKSKPSAKTAAAEAALKHMVLSKLKNAQSFEPTVAVPVPPADGAGATDADGDIKMELDGEDNLGGISWSHVACYALHKLLSSWDEGTNLAEKLVQVAGASVSLSGGSITTADKTKTFEKRSNDSFKTLLQLAQAASGGSAITPDKAKTFEKRPAKKIPDSAPTMNPIMLLNQMHPTATYEEVSKTGNPPNVQFTVKCEVNGETFLGSGSTKKGARKMCAFGACRKVLGIQYSPAFLEEHGFTEDVVGVCPASALPMQVA